jgi:hypothetical protein
VVNERVAHEQLSGRQLAKVEVRDIRCRFYGEEIERFYRERVVQPTGDAGLVVPFLNNSIHRGGYPAPGFSRYACVFHCYPSDRPARFERYREQGIPKRAPYPQDPAEDF